MRYFFSFIVLFLIFFNFSLYAKEYRAEYIIEVGGIDIGKLYWEISIKGKKYSAILKLKDKGLFSGMYKFDGDYRSYGAFINKGFYPKKYEQVWETRKKKRVVKLSFKNNFIEKLSINPKEEEGARVSFKELEKYSDPVSSFLKILNGEKSSKTIDGRRLYTMVVNDETKEDGKKIKKILIKDYVNIWADHKRNDLKYIEIFQNKGLDFQMPEEIKIKMKGIKFSLSKV
tara:strand:+ start:2727 stop:3413 length:687 start_codon:yes stop_codon:yes gene_type:complete